MSPRDEEKAGSAAPGDETDAGTMVEDKEISSGSNRDESYNKEDDLDEHLERASLPDDEEDFDIEAQHETTDVSVRTNPPSTLC